MNLMTTQLQVIQQHQVKSNLQHLQLAICPYSYEIPRSTYITATCLDAVLPTVCTDWLTDRCSCMCHEYDCHSHDCYHVQHLHINKHKRLQTEIITIQHWKIDLPVVGFHILLTAYITRWNFLTVAAISTITPAVHCTAFYVFPALQVPDHLKSNQLLPIQTTITACNFL